MSAKSPEGRRIVRDLQRELEQASAEQGRELVFSAAESAILGQISSILDRKREFLVLYQDAEDTKVKLKISAEVRLLEQAAARLVKDVKTDIPAPPGMRTVKAQRAARARWDRSRSGA